MHIVYKDICTCMWRNEVFEENAFMIIYERPNYRQNDTYREIKGNSTRLSIWQKLTKKHITYQKWMKNK